MENQNIREPGTSEAVSQIRDHKKQTDEEDNWNFMKVRSETPNGL